jgi:succinate dehydrogenase (ubiquinone) membrane anchor subunit
LPPYTFSSWEERELCSCRYCFNSCFIIAKNNCLFTADESTAFVKFYHKSAIALALLTPVAIAFSPSSLALPIDVTLGLLFPIHSHIALNYIVADYVPKSGRSIARGLVLFVSIITAAGLLKLNLTGAGMTNTVKALWTKPTGDKKACESCKKK